MALNITQKAANRIGITNIMLTLKDSVVAIKLVPITFNGPF